MKIGMFDSGRGGTTVLEAVKLALSSGASRVLILATPNTIESERVHLLACENGEYYPGAQLVDGADGVARRVEELVRERSL